MLPSLGFAASTLRAGGQVPDAVWSGSLATIIEQCGSNKTSEFFQFQSFKCFTVLFFFVTFEATLLVSSLILAWPHCHALSAIWRGHLKPRAQQASFTSASLANKHINCLPHIVLSNSTCNYWDILLQANHNNGCNSILFHAIFVNL